MKKRLTAAFLALILCACALPVPARAADVLDGYEDLNKSMWYAQGIRYCLTNNLMAGYGYKNHPSFGPDKLMTRAQLAVTLWRVEGKPVVGLSMQYHDVEDDVWYADAVRWAHAAGVMGGYSAVTFGPDDPLTREQLAAILWRYTQYRNGSAAVFTDAEYERFDDKDEISDYAAEAMRWACGMGILTGAKDRQGRRWITPSAQVTRASMATLLMRFCLDMGIEN